MSSKLHKCQLRLACTECTRCISKDCTGFFRFQAKGPEVKIRARDAYMEQIGYSDRYSASAFDAKTCNRFGKAKKRLTARDST